MNRLFAQYTFVMLSRFRNALGYSGFRGTSGAGVKGKGPGIMPIKELVKGTVLKETRCSTQGRESEMAYTIKGDGSITVDTPGEVADILRLMQRTNGVAPPSEPAVQTAPVSEDNATILLRAGGMKTIRKSTVAVYAFLLRNQHRAWTAGEMTDKCKVPKKNITQRLGDLARRNIIKRVGFGQYKVT
jgi:hypothetical protein